MNIEELQEELLQVKEQLKILTHENENYINQVNDKDNRIKELEEYNQKLFLRATSSIKEEKPKENFKSKLLGDYASLLDDEELELLKELEEDL